MFLDYSGIRVTNLTKALRFYTKGLGLVERSRGRMEHGGVWVLLEDRASHQHLELNWYPRGSKYATPFTLGEGLDHIGVRVQNLGAAGRRLRKAGAKLVAEIKWRGKVALAYYEGPDGVWVELIPHEMT
ncbi:MAG TPA: VOC family protein [Thermoplasmata archaeon]|nr:VOC family protein [Thermoplasmata archaeon]